MSWGTYNTVNQNIALSGNISNFDMVVVRFGSDVPGTAGGGAKLVWVPIDGSIETSQFEVSYMLNGTYAYGTFKFPDNTHIMLIGVNGGLAMRQVYGVKFFN